MTSRPGSALITTTAVLALLLLMGASPSTADDGRDAGSTPGPAVPTAERDARPEDGPDRDDPTAAPLGSEEAESAPGLDQGRAAGLTPGVIAEGSDPDEPPPAGDDRDDPDAGGIETAPEAVDDSVDEDDGR